MSDTPPFPPIEPPEQPGPPIGGPPPEPEPAPAPAPAEGGGGRKPWQSWLAAGVVAAAAVIGGVVALDSRGGHTSNAATATANGAPANAGTGSEGPGGRFNRNGAAGTITAIDGTNITVESNGRGNQASETVTVSTTGDTTYQDTVGGAVSDLKTGDTVLVTGTTTGATVAATRIAQQSGDLANGFPGGGRRNQGDNSGSASDFPGGPSGSGGPLGGGQGSGQGQGQGQGRFGGDFTAGSITAVNGDSLTVQTMAGATVTVTTTSDTKVEVTKAITFADLAKGDTVRVTGQLDGTEVTATAIVRGDNTGLGGFGGGPGGGGFNGPGQGNGPTSS